MHPPLSTCIVELSLHYVCMCPQMVPPNDNGHRSWSITTETRFRRFISCTTLILESGLLHPLSASWQRGYTHQNPEQWRLLRSLWRWVKCGQVCSARSAVLDNCLSPSQVRSSPHYPNWSNTIARMGSWRRRMARPLSWSSRLFALSPPRKGKLRSTVIATTHHTLLGCLPSAVNSGSNSSANRSPNSCCCYCVYVYGP